MVKIISAIMMLIIIITASVLGEIYVQDTLDEINVRTDEMITIANTEDYTELSSQFDAFIDWWHSTRDMLELLFPHTEVNQIVTRIADIKGYLSTQNTTSLLESLICLKEETGNVRNVLGFNIKNVF